MLTFFFFNFDKKKHFMDSSDQTAWEWEVESV